MSAFFRLLLGGVVEEDKGRRERLEADGTFEGKQNRARARVCVCVCVSVWRRLYLCTFPSPPLRPASPLRYSRTNAGLALGQTPPPRPPTPPSGWKKGILHLLAVSGPAVKTIAGQETAPRPNRGPGSLWATRRGPEQEIMGSSPKRSLPNV